MSPGAVVRRLGPADLDAFRALNALFAEVFGDAPAYAERPPSDAYARDLLAKPHVVALVAERDGGIVGGLVAYELEKLEQARSEFYIYDLAVAADRRRQGIATTLIGTLRVIAAGRSAQVVFVQADYVDPPAIALYEKLGTREEVLHFDIPV
ncbi:MAG: AAC(3)-I family aminoglycoside N-acetyltransferase [Novosphingobium sp.]